MKFASNRDELVTQVESNIHTFLESRDLILVDKDKLRERVKDCIDEILLFQINHNWIG
ncbi:hypothetical protein FHV99_004598 [Ochrobactrum sp. P20RRXII]|nr:hypothetical protein [Ochrobactrum sp. P20RRXII]